MTQRRTQYQLTRDSVLHVPDNPEDILLMVAGGDGSISGYIHGWGQRTPARRNHMLGHEAYRGIAVQSATGMSPSSIPMERQR